MHYQNMNFYLKSFISFAVIENNNSIIVWGKNAMIIVCLLQFSNKTVYVHLSIYQLKMMISSLKSRLEQIKCIFLTIQLNTAQFINNTQNHNSFDSSFK